MPDIQAKPFPVMVTLISISGIVTMLILGFWQLERKEQKQERLRSLELATQSQVLKLRDVAREPQKFVDFSVTVSGVADERIFLIDNRLVDGRAGYHAIQPMRTNEGLLLINLGWIKANQSRALLPEIDPMQELATVEGILALPTDNLFIKETNTAYGDFPALLQQLDLQEAERHLQASVLPFVLLAKPEESSTFVRNWQQVVMPPEKHLGYAIQWFGLAIAGLTIYLLSLGKYYKQIDTTNHQ